MSWKSILTVMGLGVSLGLMEGWARPNVLLLVSDDQGYRDLGLLNPKIATPHLDRLADVGVRLTEFYVTWPACTPSRGSLLTGRYPQRNGIYDMIRNEAPDFSYRYGSREEYDVSFERIGGMDTREVLLPEFPKEGSYRCGIYGKWDLGSLKRFLPTARGFDNFYGFVNTGIDYYTHERYGVHCMFRNHVRTGEDRGVYATTLFEREALRFLSEWRAASHSSSTCLSTRHMALPISIPRYGGRFRRPSASKSVIRQWSGNGFRENVMESRPPCRLGRPG